MYYNEVPMFSPPLLPTIIAVILLSILEIVYVSRWFLLLRYNQDLADEEFFKHYDQFADKQLSKLLENSSGKLPDAYKTRARLYQDQRKAACSYYNRYMLVRIIPSSIVALSAAFAFLYFSPSLLTGKFHLWYLATPGMILLLSMAFRICILKQGEQFHQMLIMKIVFKRIEKDQ